jgi:rubredoxin
MDEKDLDLCVECNEFPCSKYVSKLPGSHPDDPRFAYRGEAVENLRRVQEVGFDTWLEEQDARWRCPECGGKVTFYHYKCIECGHISFPERTPGTPEE